MRLSSFSNILGVMYTDKMDIIRYVETENEDGTVSTKRSNIPLYTAIPCRISFSSADNPETHKEDTNPKYLQVKVFCKANVDVIKGDKIIANRLDEEGNILATYKGTANLPLQFTSHKEILLVQVGDA